jgi:hypothetical protein
MKNMPQQACSNYYYYFHKSKECLIFRLQLVKITVFRINNTTTFLKIKNELLLLSGWFRFQIVGLEMSNPIGKGEGN